MESWIWIHKTIMLTVIKIWAEIIDLYSHFGLYFFSVVTLSVTDMDTEWHELELFYADMDFNK